MDGGAVLSGGDCQCCLWWLQSRNPMHNISSDMLDLTEPIMAACAMPKELVPGI